MSGIRAAKAAAVATAGAVKGWAAVAAVGLDPEGTAAAAGAVADAAAAPGAAWD